MFNLLNLWTKLLLGGVPLAGRDARLAGEGAGEDGRRGESAGGGYVRHLHIRVRRHEPLRLLDTVAVDELEERTAVRRIDELRDSSAVLGHYDADVRELEVGIEVRLLLRHPLLEELLLSLEGFALRTWYIVLRTWYIVPSYFPPGVFAEEDLLDGIDEHHHHKPLLRKSAGVIMGGAHPYIIDPHDKEHSAVPDDPADIYVIQRGEVILAPLAIDMYMPEQHHQ